VLGGTAASISRRRCGPWDLRGAPPAWIAVGERWLAVTTGRRRCALLAKVGETYVAVDRELDGAD
jgi:hypothetical protein